MPVSAPPGPNDSYTGAGNASGAAASGTTKPTPIGAPYALQQKWDPNDPWANQGNASLAGATGQPSAALPYDVIPARYYSGAEWTEMPTAGPDLEYLQNSLIQTGLLDAAGIVKGQPDVKTANAMQELLAISNQQGVEWRKALELRLKAVAANPLPAKVVPPLTINLSNPETLKNTAQNVAKTLHGTYLSDAELQQFVQGFQGAEAAQQQADYAQKYNPSSASGYGPGGTTVAPPSANAAAEDAIRQQHPNDLGANTFTDRLGSMLSALRSSGA